MASAFPSADGQHYLANSLFLDWKVINKGNRTLQHCHHGFWSDADVGNANDDYIQSHPVKNLGITYNADNQDGGQNGYGLNPPALAFKVLRSPGPVADQDGFDNNRDGIIDEPGEMKIMTGFMTKPQPRPGVSGDPHTPFYYFRTLQSRWNDSSRMSYGKRGYNGQEPSPFPPTTYLFPGGTDPLGLSMGGTVQNPIPAPPWFDSSSTNDWNDPRMILCSGPFTFRPGESYIYSLCNLVGFVGNHLENRDKLYAISDSLESYLPTLSQRPALFPQFSEEAHLFPNPTHGKVTIQSKSPIQSVTIFDIRGKAMPVETENAYMVRLDCSGLQKGMYWAKIVSAHGHHVRKFVVE